MKFFEALDLEPSLTLEASELERRFYERSRKWHPDRFSRASAGDQAHALEMTAVLNDAFRTLRDPVARAEYYLEQSGFEAAQAGNAQKAPPELLEEVFELNMVLEELRSGDATVRPALDDAKRRFEALLAECDGELTALFRDCDEAPADRRDPLLKQMQSVLFRRRYIGNLVREVEKELHV